MKKVLAPLAALAIVAVVAWYVLGLGQAPPPPPPAPAAAAKAPAADSGPKNPIPTGTADASLPSLKESDPTIVDAFGKFFGADAFKRFFVPEDVVQRIVATVDNLPREEYSNRLNPLVGPGGPIRTIGSDDKLAIAPGNALRYAPYVELVQATDMKAAAELYRRFYPLFQQAYVELGYPKGYFNDRLIEAIDNMLDAPEIPANTKLVTPHVLFEYADPELQRRSAGQKLLMRMGNDNARKVKAKLKEFRAEIAGPSAPK